MSGENMMALVRTMVSMLVEHPDKIRLSEKPEGTVTVIELQVAPEDYGRVIGREGVTIRAMRSLLSAACARKGLRYNLEVVE